jgi:hypothetical protein
MGFVSIYGHYPTVGVWGETRNIILFYTIVLPERSLSMTDSRSISVVDTAACIILSSTVPLFYPCNNYLKEGNCGMDRRTNGQE